MSGLGGERFNQAFTRAHFATSVAAIHQEAVGIFEPGLGDAVDEATLGKEAALETGFVALDYLGLEPRVVYYPLGLGSKKWAEVLSHHVTAEDRCGKTVKPLIETDPDLQLLAEKRWAVAVISGKKIIEEADASVAVELIRKEVAGVSYCTAEQYRALQWQLLFMSELPVDTESATRVVSEDLGRDHVMFWDPYKDVVVETSPKKDQKYAGPRPAYRPVITPQA